MLSFVFVWALASSLQLGSCAPTMRKGEDWSFPDEVQLSDDCLVFTMQGLNIISDNSSVNAVVNGIGETVYWSDLQPTSDSFDWSTLNDTLAWCERNNKEAVIRMKCSVVDKSTGYSSDDDVPFIPQWVLDECNPTVFRTDSGFIEVASPWNECVQQKYEQYVDAFVANGWLEHSRLRSLYVHGISTSTGEECNLGSTGASNAEAAGMSPDVWNHTWSRRLNAWRTAVDSHYSNAQTITQVMAKLTWVHAGYIDLDDYMDYNYVGWYLDALADDLGFGQRSGGDENFLGPFSNPIRERPSSEKVTWNETTGFFSVDETDDSFANGAVKGTEIENFSDNSDDWYDFRNSLFVDSLIRCNAVWIKSGESFTKHNLEWLEYYRKTCQSRVQRPDAIIWLRENELKNKNTGDCVTMRNWNIGLEQLNAEETPKAERVSGRRSSSIDCDSIHEDWTARSTDVGQGVDAFELQLVAQGIGASVAANENVCVKVTFLDASGGVSLALRSSDGTVIDDYQTVGAYDGDWLSVTFETNMATLTKSFAVATADDETDVTVKFVRVLRNCGNDTADGEDDDKNHAVSFQPHIGSFLIAVVFFWL